MAFYLKTREVFKNYSMVQLIENEFLIVGEEIVIGDSAVGGSAYDGGAISSLEVSFHYLIVATITGIQEYIHN